MLREEFAVVELDLVDHDVRVDVRGHGEVFLADELSDARPRNAARMCSR
jgi:hypothetical protein